MTAVVDLRDAPSTCTSLRPEIFSISCSFSENVAKLYVRAPAGRLALHPTRNPGSAPSLRLSIILMSLWGSGL